MSDSRKGQKQAFDVQKVQVWIHARTPSGARKVLLLKTIPARGAFWQPVTGGVESSDASLDDAALREAREETGLAFSGPPKPMGYEFTFQGRFGKVLETVYELEAEACEAPVLDGREHDAYEWSEAEPALARLKFESNAQPLQLLIRKWRRWEKLR